MQRCEALDFKVEHVSRRISFHNPISHSLAHATSSLKAVSVHSSADKVVCNLVRLSKNPTTIRGERIRGVQKKVVGGILKHR